MSEILVDFVLVSRAVARAVSCRVVAMLVRMGFMAGKVAMGPALLRVPLLTSVSVIPTMIQTQLQLHVSLSRTDGRSMGNN